MDMVCVAEEGRAYDPLTDPIEVVVDRAAGTMTADGTTLGADDGAGSRPWPVNEDSVMVPRIQQIYREQNGEKNEVAAIHAGLECGVLYELVDGLDMASIGPDVVGAHSPDETLYLASISKIWHLLEDLLVCLE